MSFDLTGQRALVTGASRGIGRAIALAFAQAGADVAVLARNGDLLDELVGEIEVMGRRAVACPADVLDYEQLTTAAAQAVEFLGGLDTLVNNAGGNTFSVPVAQMRMSGWEKVLRLNLDSLVVLTQSVLPMIMEAKGSVINVSSAVAVRGAPTMSHYGAAKAAVVSLTQSLALETAWAGVRVNALLPGWVETDLTDFLRATDEAEAGALSRVPMSRWARVEEVAEPAVFLASSAASFMTGQALIIDGGLTVMP